VESDSAAAKQTKGALDDPDEGEDGKDKRGPVNKARSGLVSKDSPQGPGDGDGSWEVTFRGGESVGGRSALEEEKGEEDKDLGPDTCAVMNGVYAKGIKGG